MHKWVGRFYIVAAFLASTCATAFCIVYSNGRGNKHEDIGNVILGVSAFTCALQSYVHIKAKNIEQHKIWSWRLYSVILGALLYRLYATVYYGMVFYFAVPFVRPINDAIFYIMVIPNLIIVQMIWDGKLDPLKNEKLFKYGKWIIGIFIAVTGSLITLFNWIPAMLGWETTPGADVDSEVFGQIDLSHLCSIESTKFVTVIFAFFGYSIYSSWTGRNRAQHKTYLYTKYWCFLK